MADWQRTHTCGELRETHLGQTVTLNGWVLITRNFPNQVFVDLRDRYGLTQVVIEDGDKALFAEANQLGREYVLSVTGVVRKRIAGKERADIPTGQVELEAKAVRVLNACPPLPFSVTEFPDEEPANEDLRLQYRYLDLRRRSIQQVLMLRHRVCKIIRDYMDTNGFLEMETPLLGKSTPEGARDYLVPSRVFNGEFFALPQSPQLYKQLLMISGYDKYFQLARCLRDEDLRADRQPEFTQLDVEMSFVERDDVLTLMEGLAADLLKQCLGVTLALPLPRLSYQDAMLRYGSDKPDNRFGMEIIDIGDVAGESEFKVFKDVLAAGGVVRGLNAKNAAAKFSNSDLKPGGKLSAFVTQFKAKGLAWMKCEAGKLTGSIEKFFPDAVKAKLIEKMQVENGDVLLFVADKESVACDALGALRSHLGSELKLYKNWWDEKAEYDATEEKAAKKEKRAPNPFVVKPEHFKMLWVLDFPMFAFDDEERRWVAIHHPFTAPMDEDVANLESNPGAVRAKAYDMVLNGYEVGGGSIRIHRQDVQAQVFKMLGMPLEDAQARFGFLLDALQSGAPPHGGIALGLDRWCMILAGTTNIRDVIAFPKNQKARDLMTGAPAVVEPRQLKELGVELKK
ncbi:aspartate--tRNA ligase [Limnoglobus roseus]|uniref:Aspartate--tRNA(Asp/Asn) ligase n=1 Tax=Limnoglobus roseus TaxID=2598579 RepID=A0A5C1AJ36_9BACT|nr:aspartate--tRNA ligase [Limnoglobus roseus]QEL18167.1 aspartate--tRNA ligase [Limnoglobus roseus]